MMTTRTNKPTTFTKRLIALRDEKGWTPAELAKRAGISCQALYNYETGRSEPGTFNATCLADALGVTLDYLVNGRGSK
jgi:transcriptional regulator with XRE-family HTH domain